MGQGSCGVHHWQHHFDVVIAEVLGMTLDQEIAKALKANCYVSFVPNMPGPGNVRVCCYRKGKLGTERYVLSVDGPEVLAAALAEINGEMQRSS